MSTTVRRTAGTCFALLAVFLIGAVPFASVGSAQTVGKPLNHQHGRGGSHMDRPDAHRLSTDQPAVEYSCHGTPYTFNRGCYFQTQNGGAPIFTSSGNIYELPLNDKVLITCWYAANSPPGWLNNGVQDHTTWDQHFGALWGHIPDPNIDHGGPFPWDPPYDLEACG